MSNKSIKKIMIAESGAAISTTLSSSSRQFLENTLAQATKRGYAADLKIFLLGLKLIRRLQYLLQPRRLLIF